MRNFNSKNFFVTVISMLVILSILTSGPVYAAASSGTGVITADSLTVREGPGKTYTAIGYIHKGDVVTITGSEIAADGNVWYRIPYVKDGVALTGFIHSGYVTVSQIIPSDAFEQELERQGFPESYKPYLRALHAQYPEWRFVSLQTNLDFATVIANESKLGENLVPIYSSTKSSWKSLQEGAFDWEKNNWIVLSGSYSVQASEAIIRYFMDPRNFLNSEDLFQFEQLTYSSSQTLEGVNAVLKGTFMYDKEIQSGMTYAQAFLQIGKELNISPYFLANRVRQEQGVSGTSELISGTYSGYQGYYNYFNIGASGSNQTLVIENGLKKAKDEGWNTRYKALKGGAQVVAANYILKGQDTLYLQKFDVESQYNGLYWHQYMQTLQAPYSEGHTAKRAYSSMGLLNSSFTFKIPVYNNMPADPCPQPTGDGNPNDKLSSISVNGYRISPDFNRDITSYRLVVPYSVSSVTVTASAYAPTTAISGTGVQTLQEGTNTITIKATAENGSVRDYVINIMRETAPAQPLKFRAGFVYGVNEGDTVKGVLAKFAATEEIDGSAELYDSSGEKKSGTVGTGDVLKVFSSEDHSLRAEYTIIVLGDITGDGSVATVDYLRIKKYISGEMSLTETEFAAADVDGDGTISSTDYIKIKRYINGDVELVV